jgi:hypothetical protein
VNSIYLAIYLNRKGGTLRVPINLRLQWAFDAILRPPRSLASIFRNAKNIHVTSI